MKKTLVAILFVLCFFVGGCGSVSHCDTFIIAGLHNNSPVIHFEDINDYVYLSAYSGGKVTLCDSTSCPEILSSIDVPSPGNYAEAKSIQIAENYSNQIVQRLKKKVGENNSKEVDILKALELAARSTVGSENANVIVLDPGLSTSGALDFTKGWLYSDDSPKEIVKKISAYIPNLSGRNLYWIYLGDVKFPQPELSISERKRLKDIWTEILTFTEADFTFLETIPSAEGYTDLGYVSLVSVNEDEMPVPTQKVIKVLPNTSVTFKGDSAELIDETRAVDECKELADYLANTDARILITGCTASGNREFCLQLSLERAKTIKDILVSLGIEEKRIEIEGVGYDLKYCENDRDVSGKQIEDIASKNRKVIVTEVP